MLNKTKITISAGAFALALLGACSDSNSTAGATIDPDTVATNSSNSTSTNSSNNISTIDIHFTTEPTSVQSAKNVKLSIFGDENGASGECFADGKTYAAKIQVRSGDKLEILTSLEIEEYPDKCDNLYKEFKYECDSKSGNFTEISKDSEDGSFNILCKYKGDDSETFKSVFDGFSEQVSEACSGLTEDAESSFGKFEIPSSASEGGDIVPAPEDSTNPIDIPPEDIDKYTQYPSDMGEGGVEVPSTGIFVGTLDQYTAQFTDDSTELSFDSHVLAYNGSISENCGVISRYDSEPNPIVKKIDEDEINNCFPETFEAAKTANYKFDEKCNYYVVTKSDGAQPSGHVITNISNDGIEITSVYSGGACMRSQMFIQVIFLIEDCDELVSETSATTIKTFSSSTWACEEGSYSPAKEAKAYGEWFTANIQIQ